jgi:hypothetical protein
MGGETLKPSVELSLLESIFLRVTDATLPNPVGRRVGDGLTFD